MSARHRVGDGRGAGRGGRRHRRRESAARAGVERRAAAGGGGRRSFTGYRVDFADRGAVREFAADVAAGDRPVDILVNNAGTIARSAAVDHCDDTWDNVLEVDLTAPFVLTRELGKGMVERGSGR